MFFGEPEGEIEEEELRPGSDTSPTIRIQRTRSRSDASVDGAPTFPAVDLRSRSGSTSKVDTTNNLDDVARRYGQSTGDIANSLPPLSPPPRSYTEGPAIAPSSTPRALFSGMRGSNYNKQKRHTYTPNQPLLPKVRSESDIRTTTVSSDSSWTTTEKSTTSKSSRQPKDVRDIIELGRQQFQ